jgi:hypothetical protein
MPASAKAARSRLLGADRKRVAELDGFATRRNLLD